MEKLQNVHTEHCCSIHGCKYRNDACTVLSFPDTQGYPCERCVETLGELVENPWKPRSELENLLVAIHVAVTSHKTQQDKGGLLYILHPMHVMLQMETTNERVVAILHDVVEDTTTTLNHLKFVYRFSQEIIDAVDAITKRPGEQKESYWTRVAANDLATKVKFKDMEHNTSEQRISVLPLKEQECLKTKYAKARVFITNLRTQNATASN